MISLNITLTYFELYWILVSVVSFIYYGYDKAQSLKNSKTISRISERNLLISSFIGGTIGSLLAMFIFRHKIKKSSFVIKFSLVVILQVILFYIYINKGTYLPW